MEKPDINKIIEENFKVIGRHKYNKLKSYNFDEMTTEEMVKFRERNKISVAEALKQIEKYESKNQANQNQSEKSKEYFKKVRENVVPEKKKMTKEWLWDKFNREYFKQNKVKYSTEDVYLENLKPLIYYFIGDFENFKKCKHLSKISEASFNKGILMIGGYGNGKTSTMKAFEAVLKNTNVIFKGYSANELVTLYEGCQNPLDKQEFQRISVKGTRYFDDVLTERMASNYGKSNLIKDILEERYNKNLRTYASINHKEGFGQDIKKSIEQIGEKYGPRVYDRIFDMFNVIEFKGSSFRK
ncbi:DNA replication protein [Tenacibaculum phage Gundel_1]|uniref:DNA replication protein n=1 Tax=Tenacibaculum phage Gundel_1 TaxID=2745672 RepID=A0A8E4ZFY9_9CAUD|nr:DNA replication protein [Tenacibaculum phage Gundel_1]QQV91470.1 DNA replication protein [Tenacibaculum phage Gundel_1]